MLTGIDHLVVLVGNLQEAVRCYEDLGFTVTPGGKHPVGTHNALIPFADGAYVELIAFAEPGRPHDHRWWPLLSTGGGLVDFALASDDLAADVAALAAHGLAFAARDASRVRPDGQRIVWHAADPPGAAGRLPFLIEDVTPRSLRVPEGAARQHGCGATGVARVYVAADDLDAEGAAYGVLPGLACSGRIHESGFGAAALAFTCGSAQIVVLPWLSVAPTLPENVRRRGQGVFGAALTVPGLEPGHWLDASQTLGAMLYVGAE